MEDSNTSTAKSNQNKKKESSRHASAVPIVAIIIAILIIVAGVITFYLVSKNNNGPEEVKISENSQTGALSIGHEHGSFVLSENFADNVRNLINAGYALTYVEDKNVDNVVDSSNIDSYLAKKTKTRATSLFVTNGSGSQFATINAYAKSTSEDSDSVKYSDLKLRSIELNPLPYTFDDKELDSENATYEDIQKIFGKADKYDKANDSYTYSNVNGFKFIFNMSYGTIMNIEIETIDKE